MMYVDDIALNMLERKVNLWKGTLGDGGLKLNVSNVC